MADSPTTAVSIGDWVSFMRDGTILIGEVRYINKGFGGIRQVYTYAGSIDEKSILEIRHAR